MRHSYPVLDGVAESFTVIVYGLGVNAGKRTTLLVPINDGFDGNLIPEPGKELALHLESSFFELREAQQVQELYRAILEEHAYPR
jgi:hypothetical protein